MTMPQRPWTPFIAPKHRSSKEKLGELIRRLTAKAALIAESPHFTDDGRRHDFTKTHAVDAIKDLNDIEAKARDRLRRVQSARAKLEKAAEPPPSSQADRMEMIELARVYRETPAMRDSIMARLTEEGATGMNRRLQVAFLAVPRELFGLQHDHFHDLITKRLRPDLGENGDVLDREEAEADADLDAVTATRYAILRSSDRAALAELGLAVKSPSEFTNEERRAYIEKYGHAAWQRLHWDEVAYGGSLASGDLSPMSQKAIDVNALFEDLGVDTAITPVGSTT